MNISLAGQPKDLMDKAAAIILKAKKVAALTGAGISVASGIPDFRSPGGLWSVFSPEEYATLELFYRNPTKAWKLYRALGTILMGKKPNAAHQALANLEQMGLLSGIITQNIDNLHQQAGSTAVFEIHGDHQHLQCLQCQSLLPALEADYRNAEVPACTQCGFPLKPNVVLFGEEVRSIDTIHEFIADCDLLLVIGTSAQVYPAAALPMIVHRNGGRIIEFNREQTLSASHLGARSKGADFFFQGDACATLPRLIRACGIV